MEQNEMARFSLLPCYNFDNFNISFNVPIVTINIACK